MDFLDNCVESFEEILKDGKKFVELDEKHCEKIKEELKKAYDHLKKEEIKTLKSNALPELIIKNFDLEQVWQQIELQNDALLTRSLTNVTKLVVNKDRIIFKHLKDSFNTVEVAEDNADEADPALEFDNDNAEAVEDDEGGSESDNLSLNDGESDDEDMSDEDSQKPPKKRFKPSVVDDEFFKLDEMNQFLQAEEKKMEDPDSGNDSEDSEAESDKSIDLFEETENDEVEKIRYKDFFVCQNDSKKTKRNKFLEEEEQNNEDEEEPKSTFELRQERLSEKIAEMEENAIKDKPWQLKGEITTKDRPVNSLLEDVFEFDMTTRPAPVMTQKVSLQLEDVIRQRIKDKAFDSVERKKKPVETSLEYKKKVTLDQEKSKESLAQIYEKEYLEQKAALDPESAKKKEEEPELHKEINTMATSLFQKLNALSNFHFTPTPQVSDIKIISNLPAINMEEVAPIATSDAALLAPAEIKKPHKGEIISKNELTKTDKKRELRKKKKRQREYYKKKEQRESGSGKKQEKSKEILQKVMKNRNVHKMDESVGCVKSSTAFFTKLQEDAKSLIKNKTKKQ